jgi:hypothetical protein
MMTEISETDGVSAEQLLALSEQMYARAAAALARTVERLEQADPMPPKTAVADVDGYAAAFQRVMTERDKVGKLRNQIAGTVGGRALDMDAARAEIGRRLACLRNGSPG